MGDIAIMTFSLKKDLASQITSEQIYEGSQRVCQADIWEGVSQIKKKKDSINAMKQEAIWCFTKNSGDRLPVSGSASKEIGSHHCNFTKSKKLNKLKNQHLFLDLEKRKRGEDPEQCIFPRWEEQGHTGSQRIPA